MKQIHTYRWNPPAHVQVKQTSVYLLHGTGEHAGRYEAFAKQLTDAGYRVGSHDHPGHGRSSGKRGVIDPPGAYCTQAVIQFMQFAKETDCTPILFGHSLGGLVACELVLDFALPVSGLILSAPPFAVMIRKRDWLQVKALAALAPTFTVQRPYSAKRLTHDEANQRQAEADPLNHGVKSASLVDWLLISGARQLRNANLLRVDSLLLIAGEDSVVDSAQSLSFAANAPEQHMTSKIYEGCRHEILNETPELVAPVYQDILAWLEVKVGAGNNGS